MANTLKDLKEFFSVPEKPVNNTEMVEFWKSLSDEEKEEYKNVDLNA
jgi:hypothetical protein